MMSKEYPCVYYEKKLCKKFSKNGVTSFCAMGTCPHKTPSNADRIRSMSDAELAEFLDSIAYTGTTPWDEPFADTICKSCPTTVGTIDGYKSMDLHECDFVDGKSPHGSDVVWWLRQPAEEG